MSELDELKRRNPDAARELKAAKRAMSSLEKLRQAGIARGPKPLIGPHSGRYGEIQRPTRKFGRSDLAKRQRSR